MVIVRTDSKEDEKKRMETGKMREMKHHEPGRIPLRILSVAFILFISASLFAMLSPAVSEAAVTSYYWQISNLQTFQGITTNWKEACNTNPKNNTYRITTMSTGGFTCTQGARLENGHAAPKNMLMMIKDTAYTEDTDVTGQSAQFELMDRDSGGKTFRFELGYVEAGSFVSWGFVDQTVPSGARNLYNTNLGSISGTAPAGSHLALRIIKQAGDNRARIYLANNGNYNNSGILTVDETAVCTPTGVIDVTGEPKAGSPINLTSMVSLLNGATADTYTVLDDGLSCLINKIDTYYIDSRNYNVFGNNWTDQGTYLLAQVTKTTIPPNGSSLEYNLYFNETGTYYIWFNGNDNASGGDNSLWYALDSGLVGGAQSPGTNNNWNWFNVQQVQGPDPTAITVSTPGPHILRIWSREDGFRFDGIYFTADIGAAPVGTPVPAGATVIDPTNCGSVVWTGTPAQAASVDTSGWVEGNHTLVVGGTDSICSKPISGADAFTWTSSCADPDPSTITIPAGQTGNGDPYDVSGMITTTGDVGSFEYRVTRGASGADWGTNPAAGPYTTTPHWTRLMGGYSPDNAGMILKSVSIYLPVHNAQMRLAVYAGGNLFNGPDGATLLWDAGQTSGTATGWITLNNTGPEVVIPPNTPVWIAYRGDSNNVRVQYNTSWPSGSDFQSARGRYWSNAVNGDPTQAYPATWPADSGSFNNYWYDVYLTYEADICQDWTPNPLIPASGTPCDPYVEGGTYTLNVRGTDPDCGQPVNATPENFTWSACIETLDVFVNEPVPDPITGPVTITASGRSNPATFELSDDNVTWHASPWTYTPPAGSTGTVTFYARADGDCGKVYDPTPVTVSYDTTCLPYVSITGFNPPEGVGGTTLVTISGSGFGSTQGSGVVKFNGINAVSYTSWTDGQIEVTVPSSATSGPVTVQNDSGCSATTIDFFDVCMRADPGIVFIPANGLIKKGESEEYTVRIVNNDSHCPASIFSYSLGTETGDTSGFVLPSAFTDGSTGALESGAYYDALLTVQAAGGASAGNQLNTKINIAADLPNHGAVSYTVNTTIVPDWSDHSLLLHNANRFGICSVTAFDGTSQTDCEGAGGLWTPTAKWGGNWGLAGGKYGGFTCLTCHMKHAPNIKRIKGTITAPQESFPGSSVVFDSVKGPDSFGDDINGHASSVKVCEVCHSITKYHNYNTANNQEPGPLGRIHHNESECTICHKHNRGFKNPTETCITCHSKVQGATLHTMFRRKVTGSGGDLPNIFSHHIDSTAPAPRSCEICHDHRGMSDPNVKLFDPDLDETYITYYGAASSSLTNFCIKCHDSDGASRTGGNGLTPFIDSGDSTNPQNMKAEWDKSYGHREKGNGHANCMDCHGNSGYTTGNPADTLNPQVNAHGSETKFILNEVRNFDICVKCHGNTGLGYGLDIALEFDPNNNSYHPILDTLNNGNSSALASAQLTGGWCDVRGNYTSGDCTSNGGTWTAWSASPGNNIMACIDCHNTDDDFNTGAAQGPHGSDVKWLLAGPNKAWPYTNRANNGTSSGTYFYLNSNQADLFCMNCHPDPDNNTNKVHEDGHHQGSTDGRCINCHIRVPHGGKVSRLINANDPGQPGGGTLPARLYPDGNGGVPGGGDTWLTRFRKRDRFSYQKDNCRSRLGVKACDSHDDKTQVDEWW